MRILGGILLLVVSAVLLFTALFSGFPKAIELYRQTTGGQGGYTVGYAMGYLLSQVFVVAVVIFASFLGIRLLRRK